MMTVTEGRGGMIRDLYASWSMSLAALLLRQGLMSLVLPLLCSASSSKLLAQGKSYVARA